MSLNTGTFTAISYTGHWEIIDVFASVRILIGTGTLTGIAGTLYLDWSNSEPGVTPTSDDDIMSTEAIAVGTNSSYVFTRNVIASRLRVRFTKSDAGNTIRMYINTIYNDSYDHIKIIDNTGRAVDISNGSVNVAVTGKDGLYVGTTNSPNNVALLTYPIDTEGTPIKKIGDGLSVEITDHQGYPIDSLNNCIYVHMADANGFLTGTIPSVTGANVPGVAGYMALPVSSTMREKMSADFSCALHTTTRDTSGSLGIYENRLPVELIGNDISYAFTFDTSQSLTTVPLNMVNDHLVLYSLHCYNSHANKAWIYIYDTSYATFNPDSTTIPTVFKIPVPAHSYRDLHLQRPFHLKQGLTAYGAPFDDNTTLAANTLFLSGIYSSY